MEIYKKLFSFAPEKKHYCFFSVVLSASAAVLSIMPFWYIWKFFEQLIVEKNIEMAKYYSLVVVALLLLYTVLYFAALVISHLLAFRLETNLRKIGTRHLMDASFAFFDVNESGKIRKIIDDNATQTHMIVAHLIPDITCAVITPIVMYIVMFTVDIRLGVLSVILTLIGLVQMKLMMGGKDFMVKYQKSLERMNSEAVEYVRGMQVVKIFRAGVLSFKSFYKSIMDYSSYAYNYSKSCRRPYVIFQVIFNLIIALTIPFAIYYMNRDADAKLIIAKVIFFATFSGSLFGCFMKIMYTSMYSFQAKQVVDKLESIFGAMSKKKIIHGCESEFDNFNIKFEKVSFAYEDKKVLDEVSFELEGGKTYALVGSSGGGKSTIAKLLSGFYPIDSGRILIGGKSIESYSEKALIENVAFVFQNSKLFKTSIYENVKIGRPEASREDVMKALEYARCGEILDKFIDRENTVIGSKGVYLSGGETQRIAIARAILKNASIVILDEASAAADPENEYEIQQAFRNLMCGKTVIMIAHRLSSIRNVDEILVIEDGKIIERGTDAELMAEGSKYRKLQETFARANEWRAI